MKYRSLIVAAAALIFFSSADSETKRTAALNEPAPELILTRGKSTETLEDHSGKYVILSFWSATDPASRIANVRLDRMATSLSYKGIDVISVCTGTDRALYSQLLTVDSLDADRQYHYTDSQLPFIVDDYALSDSPLLYLVSPDGTLTAAADTPQALLAHIN